MTNWYHRTSDRAAGGILEGGFDEGRARGGIPGIWLSDVPLNQADISCSDGMGAQVVLVVDLPRAIVQAHNQRPNEELGIVIPTYVLNRFPVKVHDHDLLELSDDELREAENRLEQAGRPVVATRFRDARWFFEKFPHLVDAARRERRVC